MIRLLLLIVLLGIVAGAGCRKPSEPPPVQASDQDAITQAQPQLQTMKIYLGAEEMIAELALTPDQQRIGMMFAPTWPKTPPCSSRCPTLNRLPSG